MSESNGQFSNQAKPKAPALWQWDSQVNCMRYCSEQYAEILEMTPAEAVARFDSPEALLELIHPEDRDRYYEAVNSATPGEGLKIEYRILTANGNIKHISHLGMTVFDENKKNIGIYITSEDISEIHEQKEELAQALLVLFDDNLTDCLKWMNSPHPLFNDLTPLDKIQEDGNTDAVLTVVAQLCDGVYI